MDRIVFYSNPMREWTRMQKPERNEEEFHSYDYEGPDLISRLPDGVLGAIVTLLKPEEGARTAVLSRRWRAVWWSAPLNLDDSFKDSSSVVNDEDRIRVISHILDAAHPGPVRRLSTTRIRLYNNLRVYDDWLRLPALDALQDLVLHFTVIGHRPAELPASALRFASSLRVLDLSGCSFLSLSSSALAVAFPCLTHLSLCYVAIPEELLQRIISNSPRIESLVLYINSGHRRLRLSLPRLRYLAVTVSATPIRNSDTLTDLVVEGAASLERLLLHALVTGPSIRIMGATNLKVIGYLATGFPIVELNNKSIFKCMVPVRLAEQFSTVKILALLMPELPNLEVVIAYLRCFPCLEKLKIKFHSYTSWKETTNPKDTVNCDPTASVECLDHSLKTIVMQSYRGDKPQVDFAKYFVERASILEVMKFCVNNARCCTPEWRQDHCRQLNIENRASRWALFPFMLQSELPSISWMDGVVSRDDDDPFIDCRF